MKVWINLELMLNWNFRLQGGRKGSNCPRSTVQNLLWTAFLQGDIKFELPLESSHYQTKSQWRTGLERCQIDKYSNANWWVHYYVVHNTVVIVLAVVHSKINIQSIDGEDLRLMLWVRDRAYEFLAVYFLVTSPPQWLEDTTVFELYLRQVSLFFLFLWRSESATALCKKTVSNWYKFFALQLDKSFLCALNTRLLLGYALLQWFLVSHCGLW